MNNDNKDNKNPYTGFDNINDLDKTKLLEVMNDIQIKEEVKQRIVFACSEKTDVIERHDKNVFRILGTKAGARLAVLPALAAILALSIIGYNLIPGIWDRHGQSSGCSSSVSLDTTEFSSDTSQIVNSQELTPIVATVPKWFSPGELVANQFYQNFQPGTTFKQTLSSQYVYINAQKDAIFKTEEHKNCRNFRFNIKTGNIECIDHFIRKILIPTGIMQETDRIYFKDCPPSDEFALIDIRNSKDGFKSTYRFNLQTGDLIKIKEDLNKSENWQILKDYTTLITAEFSSVWKIYLVDIVSNTRKNIVSEANATSMFDLSSSTRYAWYSILKNGNKNLRCIYNIATGAKKFITSESYPFFTPDDRFVIYFAGNKIHRFNLESNEDIVLVENASWKAQNIISIVAYDEAAGRIILSIFNDTHYDLYSLDIRTGKMVHIVDPDNGVQLNAPNVGFSAQGMSVQASRTSHVSGIVSPLTPVFLNFNNQNNNTLTTTTSSFVVSQNFVDSTSNISGSSQISISCNNSSKSYSNFSGYNITSESYKSDDAVSSQDKPKDITKPPQSAHEELPQPEPIIGRGASDYIFDKTGKYIFYYTDLHGKGGNIYCYDIASGNQFAVALPEDFIKKLTAERYNLMHPDKPFSAQYKLYLSDDATHIYLAYEVQHTNYTDPVPLSRLVEYAEKYNTIIHFGKYFDQRYYQSELPGRSYTAYTDNGKVAILNENYTTRKFALILFDKAFDSNKSYGGGEILIQKDIPADAEGFLADWWDHNYEVGTTVYSLDKVLDFVKTHDSLDGFTKIYKDFSIGWNADSGTETEFHYQICVGPNQYVNVNENYAERKLKVINAKNGTIIIEKALNPAITNSNRLPRYQ